MKPETDQWPNELAYNYITTLSSAIENCYYQKHFSEFAEIKRIARTDELTGLYNRRGFEHALQELLSSENGSRIISIVSIDMDNLKTINDEHGHAEGDFALTELAKTLKFCLSEDEFCARFGGDEFSAVLVSDSLDRTEKFTSEFLDKMATVSACTGKPYTIHASIGVSELLGWETNNIVSAMKEADDRMYQFKREYKENPPSFT